MSWTTHVDIKMQVQRLWDRGILLQASIQEEAVFPRRLTLKEPTSSDLADRFPEVREWIAALRDGESHGYRVVWREVQHRVIGKNSLPHEIWIDNLENALAMIGKRADAQRFGAMVDETRLRVPELVAWLATRPLKSLELGDTWSRLLDIVEWVRTHAGPAVYLRQVDIPGIHSKFIERHQGILSELFDRTLSGSVVRDDAQRTANFCLRYGFRSKPARIRFRILDYALAILPTDTEQDITVTHETFARIQVPVRHVFITENETNFLAFPGVKAGMAIFGAGYGFDMLAAAAWLHHCGLYYWGDIDTHGFAILDQLRREFPRTQSFLMDRNTMLDHRAFWGLEPQPTRRELPRLTNTEADVYDDLRYNRLGESVRLEQERIRFSHVEQTVARIVAEADPLDTRGSLDSLDDVGS